MVGEQFTQRFFLRTGSCGRSLKRGSPCISVGGGEGSLLNGHQVTHSSGDKDPLWVALTWSIGQKCPHRPVTLDTDCSGLHCSHVCNGNGRSSTTSRPYRSLCRPHGAVCGKLFGEGCPGVDASPSQVFILEMG